MIVRNLGALKVKGGANAKSAPPPPKSAPVFAVDPSGGLRPVTNRPLALAVESVAEKTRHVGPFSVKIADAAKVKAHDWTGYLVRLGQQAGSLNATFFTDQRAAYQFAVSLRKRTVVEAAVSGGGSPGGGVALNIHAPTGLRPTVPPPPAAGNPDAGGGSSASAEQPDNSSMPQISAWSLSTSPGSAPEAVTDSTTLSDLEPYANGSDWGPFVIDPSSGAVTDYDGSSPVDLLYFVDLDHATQYAALQSQGAAQQASIAAGDGSGAAADAGAAIVQASQAAGGTTRLLRRSLPPSLAPPTPVLAPASTTPRWVMPAVLLGGALAVALVVRAKK